MSDTAEDDRRRFKQIFAILFLVSLNASIGTTALNSLLPAIGRSTGVRDNLIVGVSSLSAFLTFSLAPFWGFQADVHGRKAIILLGALGTAVSMAATGLAVFFGLKHLYGPGLILATLVAGRALFGLVGTASFPAVQSYIGVHTTRAERTNAMAMLASANGIGSILGPAMAPFLILPVLSLGGPFIVFGILSLVVFALAASRIPDDRRRPAATHRAQIRRPKAAIWRNPAIMPFAAYTVILSVVAACNLQTLGFLVMDRLRLAPLAAQPLLGGTMMTGAVAVLIAQWGLIRWLRLKPPTLLLWGALLAVTGNVALLLATSLPLIVVGYAVTNLGFGLARPGFTAGASLAASPEDQSMVAGAMGSLQAVGLIIGPIAALTLYEWRSAVPFVVNIALMAALVVYVRVNPALRAAGEE